jgi:hypothetical protein
MPEILQPGEGPLFPTTAELKARALALLTDRARDTVVSYGELTDALGMNVRETRARGAVLWAGHRLLMLEQKKLVNIRNVGYRIVKPQEHVGVSQQEQRRARRWLRRSLATVTHVALEDLTATEVAKLMTEQARAALAIAFQKQLSKAKALPPRKELHVPPTPQLVEMLKRKVE